MIRRNIMKDSGGTNSMMKLAAINLDHMGYIKSDLGIVNSPNNLSNMTNQMNILRSLAEIRTIEVTATVDRNKFYSDSLILLAPSEKIKLASKSDNMMKLYKTGNELDPSSLSQYIDREQ